MPSALAILLCLPLLLGAVYWTVALVRILTILRSRPTIRHGLDLPIPGGGDPPLVSIVVPAHNEARVIRDCARSLLNQSYPALELIFVLDRCTDATLALLREEVAGDPRVRIIENASCPSDWAGKCNAAALGAQAARGEWLLFTDADVAFDRELVRAAVALAAHRGLGLLSLLSTLTNTLLFERIAQPMASFHLLRMYPLDRVNRAEHNRPFANGQFLLFSREVYEQIGGHARVHDDLLEDIAFARAVGKARARIGLTLADRMLIVSMYDSFAAFRRGWARIFIEACRRRPARLTWLGFRTIVSGVLLPLLQIVGIIGGGVLMTSGSVVDGACLFIAGVASAAAQLLTLGAIYRQSDVSLTALPLHPLGSLAVAVIMFGAARDLRRGTPVRWGGREYVLKPAAREEAQPRPVTDMR